MRVIEWAWLKQRCFIKKMIEKGAGAPEQRAWKWPPEPGQSEGGIWWEGEDRRAEGNEWFGIFGKWTLTCARGSSGTILGIEKSGLHPQSRCPPQLSLPFWRPPVLPASLPRAAGGSLGSGLSLVKAVCTMGSSEVGRGCGWASKKRCWSLPTLLLTVCAWLLLQIWLGDVWREGVTHAGGKAMKMELCGRDCHHGAGVLGGRHRESQATGTAVCLVGGSEGAGSGYCSQALSKR